MHAGMRSARPALLWFLSTAAVGASALFAQPPEERLDAAWRKAGLDEHQAAAHLLRRLAYGPRPGELDQIVAVGLGNWVEGQLLGDLPGALVAGRLAQLPTLALSASELAERYTPSSRVVDQAVAAGVVELADYLGENGEGRRRAADTVLRDFAERRGYLSVKELRRELLAQKLYRAVYSETQLVEVLTDFWFNHFNVSLANGHLTPHIVSYERDAIRPHVLGPFRELLGAVARHPAMLLYLGNARSVANLEAVTRFDLAMRSLDSLSPSANPTHLRTLARALRWRPPELRPAVRQRYSGLNENYARELMELHTLGVEGGYTQADVVEVARAFTGWTTFPSRRERRRLERALSEGWNIETVGFQIDGEFFFRPDWHDAEEKLILGIPWPAGRGIEDGEEVLDLLVAQRSTGYHLARKLAIRFVADQPSRAVIERLANAYELSGGEVREMVRTLVRMPEFWESRGVKIRSPFELAVAAVRSLDAEVDDTGKLAKQIGAMGQPLYGYSAPTGYPDRGAAWLNVGPLLARMNFAAHLARPGIPGVTVDLDGLFGGQDIDSDGDALRAAFDLLVGEAEEWPAFGDTLGDELPSVDQAAGWQGPVGPPANEVPVGAPGEDSPPGASRGKPSVRAAGGSGPATAPGRDRLGRADKRRLGRAVGLVLASPAFQKR